MLSIACGLKVAEAPSWLLVSIVISSGTRTCGETVSPKTAVTVTVKLAVPTFPAASVTLQSMVVVPNGNIML